MSYAYMLSWVQLFATSWTVAHQAPLSLGFSRQEYWNGLPFPSPDLLDPGIKPASPAFLALAGGICTTEPPGKPYSTHWRCPVHFGRVSKWGLGMSLQYSLTWVKSGILSPCNTEVTSQSPPSLWHTQGACHYLWRQSWYIGQTLSLCSSKAS